MKKLLLLAIFAFATNFMFAQSNGFSYQSIIRNANGDIITNQEISIRIGIIQGSTSGTEVYSESHNAATNGYGLVNIVVGNGDIIAGIFDNIDWSNWPYFMEIGVDLNGGSSFTTIGTTQLMTVPYALYAKDVENIGDADPTNELQTLELSSGNLTISDGNTVTLSGFTSPWTVEADKIYYGEGRVGIGKSSPASKLEVKADPLSSVDDPLFQVINKGGDTVFAVYDNGVQVYINDNPSKGNIGGFAVSGRTTSKGLFDEYLMVTPDSTRIYVNTDTVKGNIGGFAVSGRTSSKEINSFVNLTPENYFIGHNSGLNTTGLYNAFIGYESGFSNTEGEENIFIGHGSGYANTEGYSNVFLGNESGYNNDTGVYNVFIGNYAGYLNTYGSSNVIIGDAAGESNTLGNGNVFIGDWSGASNTSGENNIFIGEEAGWTNDTGSYNVFLGSSAGYSNFGGSDNVFLGDDAGASNIQGSDNVFLGGSSGYSNVDGLGNVFLGSAAGYENTLGNENVYVGVDAGYSNIDGEGNVFLGTSTGAMNEYGYANVFIGPYAGYFENGSEKLYIENSDVDSTEALIFGNFYDDWLRINYRLGVGRNPVSNELEIEGEASKEFPGDWLANSDRRIKTDISNINNSYETILQLRPVKYKYTKEWLLMHPKLKDRYYYNFIAQEFEKVFPESVKGSGEYLDADSEEILQIDTYNAQIVTIQAVQDLIKQNTKQAEEIERLKAKNSSITNRMEVIEQENKKLHAEIEGIKKLLLPD